MYSSTLTDRHDTDDAVDGPVVSRTVDKKLVSGKMRVWKNKRKPALWRQQTESSFSHIADWLPYKSLILPKGTLARHDTLL